MSKPGATAQEEGEIHVAVRNGEGVQLLVYRTRGGEQIKMHLGAVAALELAGSLTRAVARELAND